MCCKKNIQIINSDIIHDAHFNSDTIYVIVGEVRIQPGITLCVETDTEIYLTNGSTLTQQNTLTRTKLIFETGSRLLASNIHFKACGIDYIPENKANNGGIFFLGSSSIADKDFVQSNFSTLESYFSANYLYLSYLGGIDDPNTSNDVLDDYDAISIVGVNNNEWAIKNVYSEYSGDDGFDVENSSISLDSVIVRLPTEDGLNITSSRVNILKNLSINMTITEVFDRDIFDLEIDDGPSFVRLAPNCTVKIDGIFGDQLTLVSDDLPQPQGDQPYVFDGVLTNGQTYIYRGNFNP